MGYIIGYTNRGMMTPTAAREAEEAAIARLITSSIAGRRWRDLTPLDVAKHLVASGVHWPARSA